MDLTDTRGKTPSVLKELADFMFYKGTLVLFDKEWPHHIIVPTEDGRYISIYYNKTWGILEVQPLKADGVADSRYKERSYPSSDFRELYKYISGNWFLTVR